MGFEQWIFVGGRWLNLACVCRVVPLDRGCRIDFVDGSSELLEGHIAIEVRRAVSKEGDTRG